MKKHKNLIFYILTIGIFSLLIYVVLFQGKQNLEASRHTADIISQNSAWDEFINSFVTDMASPMALLLLQVVIILLSVRLFGWICQKIGQPTVVGEIIAGIVLGPSLLGYYFPEMAEMIFPSSSLGNISVLSQIGLVLFMFIVGMELDLKVLKNRANDAVVISHASIVFPFALGIILAYFIYDHFTHANVHFISFALFMGIAMSITAFPVLARIVHERGLNKRPLGAMVITCAAIDDVTAWCLLAGVIAIAKAGTFTSAIYVILLAVVYVVLMFKLVRPFLKRVADLQTSKNIISKSILGIFFLVLFLSAYLTEIIGIHALFGAFLAGVIMPANLNFRRLFIEKIEDVALVLLLPLFFVYTGLRTQIGLLNDSYLWIVCGCIILVAITGKFLGSALAARFVGISWKSSFTIGALMNTRGLMELVVLNIGYDLGILTPEVFAMMVVMALVTTFMTSPVLDFIEKIFKSKTPDNVIPERKVYRILAPFKNIELGEKLLLIANSFVKKSQNYSEINMVHFTPGNNLYQYNIEDEERDTFEPIIEKARQLDQPIYTMFEVASEPFAKIVKLSNDGGYDLLLIGAHYSIYQGNLLGQFLGFSTKLLRFPTHLFSFMKKSKRVSNRDVLSLGDGTHSVLRNSNLSVGIFIDKDLTEIKNVIVPILDEDDIFVGDFMERLTQNSYVRITLWDAIGLMDNSIEFVKSVRGIKAVNPYLFQLWNNNIPIDVDIFKKHDLLMVSLKSWKNLRERYPSWEKDLPSTLILND